MNELKLVTIKINLQGSVAARKIQEAWQYLDQ